jgi:DNA-binding protein H-NS
MIDMTMKAKQEDYQMANARYDAEFSKNLQLINLARSIDQQEQTEQEKQMDNARATVSTIYNTITSGGIDPSTMSESQRAQISRMEMQAGFPVGFVQQLYDKNPKGDIVYTGKDTLADGNEWITIVTKDKTT